MNAAIYIRKSREDKTKPAHRLTVQREQLPAYAKQQGWEVYIYDDGHASAARGKTEDLQQRSRLEADIRTGKINIILTIELSRLSRDDSMQDYTAWLHLCSQYQVKLATMSRILDPAQHSDWMLLLMEGGFSSVEMKVLQARMKEGRTEAFRAGKYLSGNPPMPYKYDKGQGGLIVDPDQIDTFNQIITLAANHSTRAIAETTSLPQSRVRRIVADDRLLMYQAKRIDPQTGRQISGQWPPVITELQAAAIRRNRRAGHHNQRRDVTGLLSNLNLITCSHCSKSVRTWANGKPRKSDGVKLQYYGCRHMDNRQHCHKSRMVPQHIIDDLVMTNIINTLANIDQLKTLWINNTNTDDKTIQIQKLQAELTERQKQKTRLINAITEGIIDFSDAKQKRQEIDSATAACEKRLAELNAINTDPPAWDDLHLTRTEIEQLTIKEKRQLLPTILQSISLSNAALILTYKFPRHPDGRKTAKINLPAPGHGGPKKHWIIK
jgi:DNA invertase Pin-like site-specific DNA recombinase